MRVTITHDLIDTLVDPQDETLVALRAALIRQLAGQTRLVSLTVDEREQLLASLDDCPASLAELRAVLLQEAAWRDPDGL